MQHNDKLNRAKNAKNDEFYTRYADIEAEVNAYVEHDPHVFENKTILLPCDDPSQSNFTKYFIDNFHRFGLRKLISTCYKQNEHLLKVGRVQCILDILTFAITMLMGRLLFHIAVFSFVVYNRGYGET